MQASHQRLARLPVRRKLVLGVAVDSVRLYAWQHALLTRIAVSDFAEIAVVLICPPRTPARAMHPLLPAASGAAATLIGWPLEQIFKALEGKIDCPEDAFEEREAGALFARAQIVHLSSLQAAQPHKAADEDFDVDLYLELGTACLPENLAARSRHGVWRLAHPYMQGRDCVAAAFWPVYHGWPVTECAITRVRPGCTTDVVVRSFPTTNPYSVKLNRSALYWRAASLFAAKLHEMQQQGGGRHGDSPLRGRPEMSAGSHPPYAGDDHEAAGRRFSMAPTVRDQADEAPRSVQALGQPATMHLARHIARNVSRRAKASAARKLSLDRWLLLFRFGEDLATDPSVFTRLVPPKDRFWADPHVIKRGDRYFIFIEECPFSTGKGHIAVIAMDATGRCDPPLTVLERDYHLSYPCVFEHQGALFMVPESEANRTIDLYRCVDFPARWEHVATLIDGISAVDSTLLHEQGRWWLFANVIDHPGASYSEELSIFHADELLGPWVPHERNPVLSDARRARPAGAIFRRNGRLYRPAQDCSVRYGYGLRIHEITALSTENYSEVEVNAIFPDWDSSIIGTHTLSYTPGLTVIDALQPRRRF